MAAARAAGGAVGVSRRSSAHLCRRTRRWKQVRARGCLICFQLQLRPSPLCNPEFKIAGSFLVRMEVTMTGRLAVSLLLLSLSLSTFTCVAASQEASPQAEPVGPSVMAGQIITKVAPIYPPLARQARIQGNV